MEDFLKEIPRGFSKGINWEISENQWKVFLKNNSVISLKEFVKEFMEEYLKFFFEKLLKQIIVNFLIHTIGTSERIPENNFRMISTIIFKEKP